MRKISKGRLGAKVTGASVQFNTSELWKSITAIGGPATREALGVSSLTFWQSIFAKLRGVGKGEPPQLSSYTVNGVAAIIPNQALTNLARRA
jgi:hypothetical protein